MIYLFSGDDVKSKLAGYEKFIKSISMGQEVVLISRNQFDPVQVESLYSGSSLFSATSIVVFQGILEREETRDFILEKLELLGESTSSFIFLEGKLNKPIIDAFKKVRAEIKIFELLKEKKEKFDNFLIANTFEKKDKLNTWIYFREAVLSGAGMEELIGILFWKIKDMILKRNFGKFSETELKDLASRISYLLPEARKEGRDAESVFEQFLLETF